MKAIQVQVTITLDEAVAKSLAELLAPAIKQALASPTSEADEKKKARLLASQNAIFGGEKPPEDQGMLINTKQAAKLLKVAPRTLWQMYATGKMPRPIRLGRAVRWSLDVLRKWIEDRCPTEGLRAKSVESS